LTTENGILRQNRKEIEKQRAHKTPGVTLNLFQGLPGTSVAWAGEDGEMLKQVRHDFVQYNNLQNNEFAD
jgi:hypothetical protein